MQWNSCANASSSADSLYRKSKPILQSNSILWSVSFKTGFLPLILSLYALQMLETNRPNLIPSGLLVTYWNLISRWPFFSLNLFRRVIHWSNFRLAFRFGGLERCRKEFLYGAIVKASTVSLIYQESSIRKRSTIQAPQ